VNVDVDRVADSPGLEQEAPRSVGAARGFLSRFFSSKLTVVGVVVFLGVILLVVVGPLILDINPNTQDLANQFANPSGRHLLGTDVLGRDVLSRVLYGGRLSLLLAGVCVVLALLTGALIGLVTGFVGGWIDAVTMRIMDVMLAIPSLLLAVAIAAALGPSLRTLVIAIVVPNIPSDARLIRSVVISVREQDYVFAARACGVRPSRIMFRHVLKNCMSPIVTNTAIIFGFTLLEIGALGFLGLGVQPPQIEWGTLLTDAQTYLFNRPLVVLAPGLALFLVAFAANLIGDGLRDGFDPTK
jgi:peptide/nickel transport system permease protein